MNNFYCRFQCVYLKLSMDLHPYHSQRLNTTRCAATRSAQLLIVARAVGAAAVQHIRVKDMQRGG